MRGAIRIFLIAAAAIVVGVLVWQGITAHGNPDPTAANMTSTATTLSIAVLVFREGLESLLVLSAILASMVGPNQPHRRPVIGGAAVAFVASVITWFVAVGIISNLSENFSALNVQAATGLLAVVVLLIVMNWFFHKVYWGGWIAMHNRTKRKLLQEARGPETGHKRVMWGLVLLGFTSLYREGFEVVLFLQNYYLKMGGAAVLQGTLLGLFFTAIVAVLTFVAHRRLPYRKMLVLTGVMLGFVLLVMVGEQAQEMQLANWIPTTPIGSLETHIPPWMGLWFAVYPTVETLAAQILAAVIVVGSYVIVRLRATGLQRAAGTQCAGPLVCPLTQVKAGAVVCIKELGASAEVCDRLREMGLYEEQRVKLLSRNASVVCELCQAQRLTLTKEVAETILVEPLRAGEVI
jgi:high-affinity iron transporter